MIDKSEPYAVGDVVCKINPPATGTVTCKHILAHKAVGYGLAASIGGTVRDGIMPSRCRT
jgi:hypothetical protein